MSSFRNISIFIVLFLVFTVECIYSVPVSFQYGLTKNGRIVYGEFVKSEDSIFLRDEFVGQSFPQSHFKSIFSVDYYNTIKENSRLDSIYSSLVYFGAAEEFIWQPESFFQSDQNVRYVKFGLLFTTALLYHRVHHTNRRLSKSIEFWNAEGRRTRFARAQNNYYASLVIGGLYLIFQTVYSAYYFGKTGSGLDLNIQEIQPIPASDYIQDTRSGTMFLDNNSEFTFFEWTATF